MNGRNIFMGYLNMEEMTRETLDSDGWLRSGDVGRKDADGFVFITGRIKGINIYIFFSKPAATTVSASLEKPTRLCRLMSWRCGCMHQHRQDIKSK